MPKTIFKCDWCEKEFQDYPSQRKKGNKFCSRACKYEWNKTLPGHWKGKKMSDESKRKMSKNHADVSGEKNGRWNGGRRIDKDGYVLIWCKEHPYADYHGYVREHRLVMEKYLGRYLTKNEVVHHVDKNKRNNSVENLKVFGSTREHTKHEWEEGSYKNSWENRRSKKS